MTLEVEYWYKMDVQELLTTREVARLLRLNEKKIYQLIREAGLPHVRIAGKWLFPREQLVGWIRLRVEGQGDLLLAGSDDPLLGRLLGLYNGKRGAEGLAFYASVGSERGLEALRDGKAQGCCVHLLDPEVQEYNLPFLERWLQEDYAVVVLWHRRQGLLLPRGNPLGIEGVGDAVRRGARFALRNPGSGTRRLLEFLLRSEGYEPGEVKGWGEGYSSHWEAALQVLMGKADVALGIEYMAHLLGLDFIPVREERFDLVLEAEVWGMKQVQRLFEVLRSELWRVPGYSFRETGKVLREP